MAHTLDEVFSRLTTRWMDPAATWQCVGCQREMVGPPRPGKLCSTCALASIEKRRRSQPKRTVLARAGCPARYRTEIDPHRLSWLGARGTETGWPTDEHHGCLDRWEGSPWSVVLSGPNGSGKSMLAAELLYRLHHGGCQPLLWIRPTDFLRAGFDARHLAADAERTGALVIDDLGTERLEGTVLVGEVLEARWGYQRPTVVTTHLPLSLAAGRESGTDSLQRRIPAAYDRLTDGLLIRLDGESQRGRP